MELLNELSSLRCQPKVAIVFGTTIGNVYDWEYDESCEGLKCWMANKEDIIKSLPAGCQVIGTSSRGIVGLQDGNVRELENNETEVVTYCSSVFCHGHKVFIIIYTQTLPISDTNNFYVIS